MPSADFCAGFSEPYGPLSPDFEAATQISWGKFNCFRRTPAGYTAMVLDGYGLRDGQPTRPTITASYPVPVCQAAASLHASSGPRLAATPLRFTSLHHHQVGRGLSPHELLNMPSTLPLHNRWLCSIKGQKTGRAVCCYFNNNLRRVPRGYLVDSAAVMEELAEGLGLLRRVLIRSTSTITCT
jgi:hypothetical protein